MTNRTPQGWWHAPSDANPPTTVAAEAAERLGSLTSRIGIVQTAEGMAVVADGTTTLGPSSSPSDSASPLLATAPPTTPQHLGDATFLSDHGLRYPYMTGAMANGIGSCEIVEAMSQAGMLGSFGAAGLSVERVTQAIDRLQASLRDKPFCINLIHSPNEPSHEAAIANLLLKRGVKHVEASAYLDLTPPIVKYRIAGVHTNSNGRVVSSNRVIAKISRAEVATRFLSPPPERIVNELLQAGSISPEQAELARQLPMCDDMIAEADSGGHTDNRPAITLLPTIIALRNRLQLQFQYPQAPRVGLAGGIATPASVAGAFALGAAFVVTGSINQACVESGSSDAVRKMLAEAGQADIIMAPAADMFEMGVKVQVLKRGTMFAMRGAKLFELYRQFSSWEAIPATERALIEKTLLRTSFEDIWNQTVEFFQRRDPSQLVKAEADSKHKMALVFRWYLGLSSRWANSGDANRQLDYQVWCGPAMGAFNEWSKGSFLEQPKHRRVVTVAKNLLYGACVHMRRIGLEQQCGPLPESWFPDCPFTDDELNLRLT